MNKCKKTIFGTKHNYSEWELVDEQMLYSYGEISGNVIIQEKKCDDCGYIKRQIRKVGN